MLKFFKILVYSNLFVSICIAFAAAKSFMVLNLEPDYRLIVCLFLGTFCVYNFQRLYRLKHTKINALNERLIWYINHKKLIFIFLSFAFAGVCYNLLFLSKEKIFLLTFLFLITLLYVLPVVKTKHGMLSLRELPYLKIFLISLVWAILLSLFLTPIQYWKQPFTITLLIERFLFILAITLPFDIRDLEFDSSNNLKTIPQLLGIKNTVALSIVLLTVAFTLNCYLLKNELHLEVGVAIFLIELIILLGTLKQRKELYYSGLVEGIMILDFLMVIAI